MGEEGVGDEFRELGRPEIGGDDFFARNPVRVNRDEGFEGGLAFRGLLAADEDAVGIFHVGDGSAFSEELRVREDLEGGVGGGVRGDDALDRGGGFNRDGGFLDDDFIAVRNFCDESGGGLDVAEVGRAACTDAVGFRGSSDTDEDEIGCGDGGFEVGGEVEVFAAAGLDDFLEAGFVDGEGIGVPCVDAGLVHVADRDLDVGAFVGDHGHGWAADVAGAEAADGGYFHKL